MKRSSQESISPNDPPIRSLRDQDGRGVFEITQGSCRAYIYLSQLGAVAQPHNELARILSSQGVNVITLERRRALLTRLSIATDFSGSVVIAHRPGWVTDTIYALGCGTVYDSGELTGDVAILFQTSARFSTNGSLKHWLADIGTLLDGQKLLQTLCGFSLAAPLLRPFGATADVSENFGLELAGGSSLGKTTALRVATSLWGGDNDRGLSFLLSWNVTDNGLEHMMIAQSDNVLAIDDATLLGPDRRGRVSRRKNQVMRMSAGKPKTRFGDVKQEQPSRFTMLSSSNDYQMTFDLQDRHTDEAASVRMSKIDVFSPLGVLDQPGAGGPADTISRLNELASAHHGYAGRQFMQRLTRARATNEQALKRFITLMVGKFREAAGYQNLAPTDKRVCNQFALVYAAEHLAERFALRPTSWGKPGEATLMVFRLATGTSGPAKLSNIVQFEKHLAKQRHRLSEPSTKSNETRPSSDQVLGIVKAAQKDRIELIMSCSEFDHEFTAIPLLLKSLRGSGALIHDHPHLTTGRDLGSGEGPRQAYVILLEPAAYPGELKILQSSEATIHSGSSTGGVVGDPAMPEENTDDHLVKVRSGPPESRRAALQAPPPKGLTLVPRRQSPLSA
jgi:hypothetical protein